MIPCLKCPEDIDPLIECQRVLARGGPRGKPGNRASLHKDGEGKNLKKKKKKVGMSWNLKLVVNATELFTEMVNFKLFKSDCLPQDLLRGEVGSRFSLAVDPCQNDTTSPARPRFVIFYLFGQDGFFFFLNLLLKSMIFFLLTRKVYFKRTVYRTL